MPGVVTPGIRDRVSEKSVTVNQALTTQGGDHVISSGDTEKAAQKSETVSCLKYIQREKKSRRQQEGHLCHLAMLGTDSQYHTDQGRSPGTGAGTEAHLAKCSQLSDVLAVQ